MLASSKPVCFVATAKPEAAKYFYETILGLQFLSESPYALVFDANGITLRIQKMHTVDPQPQTSFGWVVENVHSAIALLRIKGVRFERYDPLPQDEAGVWTTPGGAHVAWFKDPDGNTLSISDEPEHHYPQVH